MFIKVFVVVVYFSIAIANQLQVPDSKVTKSNLKAEDPPCPECVVCYLKCKCILPGTDIIKNFSDFIVPRPEYCPECNCDDVEDCSGTYRPCPSQFK